MSNANRLQEQVAKSYAGLSTKLKAAADYVVANQTDVATRSLRSVSSASGVSPATLSRLARSLSFDSYEDMRELCRETLGERSLSFSERAEALKNSQQAEQSMLDRQAAACVLNISKLGEQLNRNLLQDAVNALEKAENVVLFGAFGSTGIVEYVAYLANYFATNWTLAGRMGASLGASLATLNERDTLLIVTKAPYAKKAVRAAEYAREAGAQVIIISDSHACPAIKYATFPFIVPSDSPQFFSSYAATLSLLETMIAMLVAQSGEDASRRIRDVERRNQSLGEFWND
ncbi:MurR/RpiR family transcriptional regulator [Shimia sp. MMG029]|uniref:MurR/RpiR family transcriptional regulator n=1 Tax=Shimia sp. MMG029 TaxID=3021978 RepID=UPI0022FE0185|nr:MurR/RpiR family transcriptional regulator [Shimia sp. MMG029]MDA5556647.1 MurR/RpiR family transcriptional regulator [Shimia sp. MMG029]